MLNKTASQLIEDIFEIEKQAFNVAPIVNFVKGPGTNMAKNFIKSDAGKKTLMGAALGAGTGFVNPGVKINSDGQVVNKNRLGSVFKGALTGGALTGAYLGGQQLVNKLPLNFKTASSKIDEMFFEKLF